MPNFHENNSFFNAKRQTKSPDDRRRNHRLQTTMLSSNNDKCDHSPLVPLRQRAKANLKINIDKVPLLA